MEARLTIKLPDALRKRAKAIAALRGESVSDVVRTALSEYVTEAIEEAEDIRLVDEIEARIAAGEVKLRDWEEVEATLDDDGVSP